MNRTTYPVVFALLGAVVAVLIFFVWRRAAPAERIEPSTAPPNPPPVPLPRMPQSPDVIGLFPEPGANR